MTYLIRDDVLTAHLAGEAVLLDLRTKQYYRKSWMHWCRSSPWTPPRLGQRWTGR